MLWTCCGTRVSVPSNLYFYSSVEKSAMPNLHQIVQNWYCGFSTHKYGWMWTYPKWDLERNVQYYIKYLAALRYVHRHSAAGPQNKISMQKSPPIGADFATVLLQCKIRDKFLAKFLHAYSILWKTCCESEPCECILRVCSHDCWVEAENFSVESTSKIRAFTHRF